MPSTYTLCSWALICGLAGLFFYYYYYKPSQARQAGLSKGVAKGAEKKKEPKKLRKGRKDDVPIQERTQKEQQKLSAEYPPLANDVDQLEEELDNKEFARQLSSAKIGTLMPSKSQDGIRQRSVKQTRAQEKPVETGSDNGTTGADADDDRSPLNSPELSATIMSPVANGDVSDMLEARTPGPSVLRVTSPPTSAVVKKVKPAATPQVAETKKQRQNRQKAEMKKQIREEEEKERKILLEKQRRAAREAEGRAAKDGSAFMASKPPNMSAWTAPVTNETTNGKVNHSTGAAKIDFLDTYTPKGSASQETTQSESELAGSDWQKVAASISEEEQVRRALEDSDSWKTVGKDKRKKKTQPIATTIPKSIDDDESSDYAPPRLVPPSKPGQVWGMTLVEKHEDGHYEEYRTDVQDSEWEVA